DAVRGAGEGEGARPEEFEGVGLDGVPGLLADRAGGAQRDGAARGVEVHRGQAAGLTEELAAAARQRVDVQARDVRLERAPPAVSSTKKPPPAVEPFTVTASISSASPELPMPALAPVALRSMTAAITSAAASLTASIMPPPALTATRPVVVPARSSVMLAAP